MVVGRINDGGGPSLKRRSIANVSRNHQWAVAAYVDTTGHLAPGQPCNAATSIASPERATTLGAARQEIRMGVRGVLLLVLCMGAAACGGPAPQASPSSQAGVAPASARPSEASMPTASPVAPSPTPGSTATSGSPGLLPPGSEARVVVDALRLRREPRANAPIVATLPLDAIVQMEAEPPFQRSVDGIEWRSVSYSPGSGRASLSGWVAAGDGELPFLAADAIECPTKPASIQALAAMTDWAHVTCFRNRELVIEGIVITGLGGTTVGDYGPMWLAFPFAFGGVIQAGDDILVYKMPGQRPDGLVDGQKLRVTGHFDDPAAATCRVAYGEPAVPEPASLAIAYCRSQFVATSVEAIG